MNNSTKVVTGVVRLSYLHALEPVSVNGGDPKYSASIIIPKSDTATIDAINKAIDAAIEAGLGKFGGKKPKKSAIKIPLRDGDLERDDPAYADAMFVNANSRTAPQIVDRHVKPILDPEEIYSGMYARVSINFTPSTRMGIRGLPAVLEISRRFGTENPWEAAAVLKRTSSPMKPMILMTIS